MGRSCHIIWYDEIDSTNSEATRRLGELDNMSVIAARCQTAGRGKDNRKWLAAPGENMTFTIVQKYALPGDKMAFLFSERPENAPWPPFPAACQMLISAAAAASVVRFLTEFGLSAWVKWPNDVYVDSLKICGILIEHRTDGRHLSASIIGIGINLNQTAFPAELVNPVSVAVLTGKRFGTDACLDRFCSIFASKMESVYSELPHLSNVISGAFALEDGASGDENLRACFAQCVNVLL